MGYNSVPALQHFSLANSLGAAERDNLQASQKKLTDYRAGRERETDRKTDAFNNALSGYKQGAGADQPVFSELSKIDPVRTAQLANVEIGNKTRQDKAVQDKKIQQQAQIFKSITAQSNILSKAASAETQEQADAIMAAGASLFGENVPVITINGRIATITRPDGSVVKGHSAAMSAMNVELMAAYRKNPELMGDQAFAESLAIKHGVDIKFAPKKDERTNPQKEFDRYKKNNPDYEGDFVQFGKDQKAGADSKTAFGKLIGEWGAAEEGSQEKALYQKKIDKATAIAGGVNKNPSEKEAVDKVSQIKKNIATFGSTNTVTDLMIAMVPSLKGFEGKELAADAKKVVTDAMKKQLIYYEGFLPESYNKNDRLNLGL